MFRYQQLPPHNLRLFPSPSRHALSTLFSHRGDTSRALIYHRSPSAVLTHRSKFRRGHEHAKRLVHLPRRSRVPIYVGGVCG
uniref:Uncharacterized protein n=1 Tax=Aegilops tauschii subsp. strangulata TaxID=200361 RepID=A0A453LSE8_AEGTS